MGKISLAAMALAALIAFPATRAGAETVMLRSISSGEYENGIFTERNDEFEAEAVIDETAGTVRISVVVKSTREGRIEDDIEYEITNVMESKGISAISVSRDKKGQKIITAVRDSGLGSSEILMVGEDFYEFTRAANGKFYLEYGEVAGGAL